MTARQVVAVVRPVEIRRHDADVAASVLQIEVIAELDARDLGDRVRLVGLLEGPGEQIFLANGLRAVAWIDAARAQEHESFYSGAVSAVDEVEFDGEVL